MKISPWYAPSVSVLIIQVDRFVETFPKQAYFTSWSRLLRLALSSVGYRIISSLQQSASTNGQKRCCVLCTLHYTATSFYIIPSCIIFTRLSGLQQLSADNRLWPPCNMRGERQLCTSGLPVGTKKPIVTTDTSILATPTTRSPYIHDNNEEEDTHFFAFAARERLYGADTT